MVQVILRQVFYLLYFSSPTKFSLQILNFSSSFNYIHHDLTKVSEIYFWNLDFIISWVMVGLQPMNYSRAGSNRQTNCILIFLVLMADLNSKQTTENVNGRQTLLKVHATD